MSSINFKKIIILGGNSETGAIVEIANEMGLYSIVIDPYSNSPSKKKASKTYEIDVRDLDAIESVVREEKVDGVLVGVADPLVPYYQKICARCNFYCYANEKAIHTLTSKSNFAEKCSEYKISVTPNMHINYELESDVENLDYPVVVKPVDSGAGVGISVCRNPEEFKSGVYKALEVSISKELIIEKFMECDDIFAYYTFIDGVAHLSAIADRYKTDKQGQLSSVCLAAEYPSRYTDRFINEMHYKLVEMFKDLEILNGVLLIQFFVDSTSFYAYDPGFRLQGEAPHLYLKYFNKFDHREMLINFSLSGKMFGPDFVNFNDYRFKGKYATTLWIVLRVGVIGEITGINELNMNPNVIHVMLRFKVGDSVTPEMLGTERQVFARIYTVANTVDESAKLIAFINENLFINDEKGMNMVLDRYHKKNI